MNVLISVHPVIQVPNQLVGAPSGTNVTLECYVEAYPKPIIYWDRETGKIKIYSLLYVTMSNL